jgi:hypothetical protein
LILQAVQRVVIIRIRIRRGRIACRKRGLDGLIERGLSNLAFLFGCVLMFIGVG